MSKRKEVPKDRPINRKITELLKIAAVMPTFTNFWGDEQPPRIPNKTFVELKLQHKV